MIDQIIRILEFMLNAFIKIWPFILITIPISVFVNVSGAGKHIRKILNKQPAVSILLATLFGAISPLCSCTVIPVISSLLIAGVPLAPVMSFWIASPSMDPEIFFLSAAQLGWGLAVWRLAATFVLSLGAGFVTLYLQKRGFFADGILKKTKIKSKRPKVLSGTAELAAATNAGTVHTTSLGVQTSEVSQEGGCCGGSPTPEDPVKKGKAAAKTSACGFVPRQDPLAVKQTSCCSSQKTETCQTEESPGCGCQSQNQTTGAGMDSTSKLTFKKVRTEVLRSVWFVGRFMALAFFLEALIIFYVPQAMVENILGSSGGVSILTSTAIGVPLYTSTISALGILKGLLVKGMLPSAALAFLISGPVTTIPAMTAVFGIASKKVFIVYLVTAFAGALFFGALHFAISAIL